MRIAQLTYSCTPPVGGADVYAVLLHSTLSAEGYDCVVYQATSPEGCQWARQIRGPCGRSFWAAPLGLRRLRRELEGYDILIAHYANYHWAVDWHPRTILISHGVWWDDRPRALRSRIKRALTRRAYRLATAVVANDTFFFREMGLGVQPGTAPHSAIEPGRWYLPNGVDTDLFRPSPSKPHSSEPVVLVPRNLYRNRGVHLAIEALALLRREVPARMTVVGAVGQPEYARACEALVRRLGLSSCVQFAGPVPWERMPEVYQSVTVTLVPTVCGEGTSLAALESMASGVPCVGTAVAGLLDLPLVHCEPTPQGLSTGLLHALESADEIASRQRAAVVREFTLARWRASWLGVVEEVTRGTPSPSAPGPSAAGGRGRG